MIRGDGGRSSGADHAWARRLRRAIADEPLLGSLIDACASLASVGIDIDLLEEIFRRQERDWRRQHKLEGLGLPDSFMNFALAIYVYTLEDPAVYTVVNRAMYNPARRSVHGVLPGPDLSPELQACLPYIRFLDTALERLPEAFIFRGRVHRGVRSPPRRARTHPRLIQSTRNRPPILPPRMTECSPLNDGVPPPKDQGPSGPRLRHCVSLRLRAARRSNGSSRARTTTTRSATSKRTRPSTGTSSRVRAGSAN